MQTCCIVLCCDVMCCAVVCVQDRDLVGRAAGGLSCYFFNTFFLAKLYVHEGKYNYKNVSGDVRVVCLVSPGCGGTCVCVSGM